jgi:TraB/PrgY/gumN family
MRLRPTFVAVGAAHLPGKAGVIALLRERGYTLRPVLATQRTGMARAIKNTPYTPNWQTFRNESAGYALQVPCRPYKANFTDLPVPMYVGMDFPGGWVYYFFAFTLDPAANRDQEALRKKLLTSLLESMEVEGTPYPVKSGELAGEEAIVVHNEQSLRIRAVSNDKMVFVIFAGIDEAIVRNPMLDTMFNSLTTFPALPLSQRQWTTRVDSLGGFSIPMPAEVSRLAEGPSMPDSDPNFYKVFFSADDEQTREDFFLSYALVESQVLSEYDPLARLVDSISYKYDYATIRDERDFNVDGFRAHEFILDLDGVNTGIYRCVQRGDRLYMYGGTYTDKAESKTRILSALDAFRFLPSEPAETPAEHAHLHRQVPRARAPLLQ